MSSILPNTYTRLAYIESTGTQYIDTSISYNTTSEFILEMQLSFTDVSLADQCFGFTGNTGRYCGLATNTWTYTNVKAVIGTKYNIKFIEQGANYTTICNGVCAHGSNGNINVPTSMNMILFATHYSYNDATIAYYTKSKLYICRIYKDGKLIRNFIPCIRNSDGQVGLYDLITDDFYGSLGSDHFIAGEEPVEVFYNKYVLHLGNDTYSSACLGNYLFDWKSDLETEIEEPIPIVDYCNNYVKNNILSFTVDNINSSNGNMTVNFTPVTDTKILNAVDSGKVKFRIQLLMHADNLEGKGYSYNLQPLTQRTPEERWQLAEQYQHTNDWIDRWYPPWKKVRSHEAAYYGRSWLDLTKAQLQAGTVTLNNVVNVRTHQPVKTPYRGYLDSATGYSRSPLASTSKSRLAGTTRYYDYAALFYIPALGRGTKHTFQYHHQGYYRVSDNAVIFAARHNIPDSN